MLGSAVVSISKRFNPVRSKTVKPVLVGLVFVVVAAACSSDGGRGETPVSSAPNVADSSAPDETTTTVVEEVTTTTVEVHDDDDGSVTVVEDGDAAETTTTDDLDNQTTTTAAAPSTTAAPTTTPTTTVPPPTATPTSAPPTTTVPPPTAAPTPTTAAPATTAAPTPTTAAPTTTEPAERVDGGTPAYLGRFDDDCPGTIMGRFLAGQPTGCRLDNGTVLCLTAPYSPQGDRLYNAAEWKTCPDFDSNRPPCDTSQTAVHDYIDRWDYVFTSADQGSYVRPSWEGTIDLTPGLWFGELCVRNNEGSQLGTPEPQ